MQTHPTNYPSDLTDEEWNQIKSLVPAPKSGKGKRGRPLKLDRRTLVNAIFYVDRSRLRVALSAQGLRTLANRLWLLSAVEPGLDVDLYP